MPPASARVALPETSPGPSRRGFFRGGTAAAFVIGFSVPIGVIAAMEGGEYAPNAFIRIDRQGIVTLVMPQVEMGQGVYTSISMILAEEVDADWAKVKIEHAPADEAHYANPMLEMQATGNSNSIRAWWKPLRVAAAAARACLVEAAAGGWGVPAAACRTEAGFVIHDASGRKAAYGDLIGRAAGITPPKDPPLKDPKDFRLIGRPLKRLDTPDKTNGRAQYGIDALPPGVKFATLAQSPVLGGKVAHVDEAAARAVPGVRQVVVLDDLVAVVGDHMWAAKQGLEALDVTWNDGPNGGVSSELIWDRLRTAGQREGSVAKSVGDADRALAAGDVVAADLRDAAARPRADGAAELHGPHHADVRRGLDRHPGDGTRSRGGRQGRRAAREPGHRPQPPAWAAGSGASSSPTWPTRPRASPSKSTHRSRSSGRARRTSATTIYRPAYHDLLWARLDGAAHRRLEAPRHRLGGDGALRPAAVRRRGSIPTASIPPSISPTTSRTCESSSTARSRRASTPASGAASGRTTTSSPSRASSTSWRARRARTRSRSGAPISTRLAPSAARRSTWWREKSGWGSPLPPRLRARRRRADVVRQLHRHRRGVRGGRRRRGDPAPRDQRRRHRHRRQSGHHRRPAAGRPGLRPHRGALWRDHARRTDASSSRTSTTTACCASTRCRRSRCM